MKHMYLIALAIIITACSAHQTVSTPIAIATLTLVPPTATPIPPTETPIPSTPTNEIKTLTFAGPEPRWQIVRYPRKT